MAPNSPSEPTGSLDSSPPAGLLPAQRDLAARLPGAASLDEALAVCLDAAIRVSGMDCGAIYLVDSLTEGATLALATGLSQGFLDAVSCLPPGSPRARRVVSGVPMYRRCEGDPEHPDEVTQREGLRAIAVIPITHRDRVIASFFLGSHSLDEVSAGSRHALEEIGAIYCSLLGTLLERKLIEERRQRLAQGLRAVIAAADELIACPDVDSLLRRAVELARERIGFERCGLSLLQSGRVCGTYGTDLLGRTTDERGVDFPTRDESWLEEVLRRPSEATRWVRLEDPLIQVVDGELVSVGEGWSVVTPIGSPGRLIGLMFNDSAITGAPLDETLQEVGVLYALLLARTIEQRRLEDQIRHAQRLESLASLAGGVAHHFNNLLVGVLGNAALARAQLPAGSPLSRYVNQIEVAATRAADLSKQMLAYSGRGAFVVEPLDLSGLVAEMADLLACSIGGRAALKCELAAGLPPMEGDATELRQLVMNLILNASDALGNSRGAITVTTGAIRADRACLAATYLNDDLPPGRYVYLEVADTGCGMDEATRARIFDPFFTTKDVGRGLGLAAVLGIVRGHRGAITVHNQPGEGTAFRVLFPALEGAGAHPDASPAPGNAAADCRAGDTVLVADDEALVRLVLQAALQDAGFAVLSAGDGAQAVETFREHAADIVAVVLDVTMPNMSGEEALREIRRLAPGVPVVMSSGYSERHALAGLADDSRIAFIAKPYDPAELVAAVLRLVSAE